MDCVINDGLAIGFVKILIIICIATMMVEIAVDLMSIPNIALNVNAKQLPVMKA